MSRASARSNRSGDTVSVRSATRSMPSRSRLTSRRTSAARMSTTAACWIGSSRPTAPKSISPSVPSAKAKTLPGCGSAWKNPTPSTWSIVVAQQLLGERVAVDAGRVELIDVGQGAAVEVLLHEHAARAQNSRYTLRHPNARARAEQQSPSLPSRRPRAGSRAPRADSAANWSSTSPERRPCPNTVRRCATFASERERGEIALDHFLDARALHLHDDGLARVQPRAVGLTDRRGREWLPVELGEDLLDLGTELGFEHRLHLLHRDRRDPVLQGAELARRSRGARSRRGLRRSGRA